jgi:anti-sigma regulatory factor (Ser/Thr protein kinase)
MPQADALPLVSTLVVAAVPKAVHWAREHVISALSAWELDGDLVQVATLLASELVTNAINASADGTRAAEPGNGARVAIRLDLPDDTLRIAVWDGGTGAPVLMAATSESECGRGLQLVAALAKQWAANRDGKVVWCDIETGG